MSHGATREYVERTRQRYLMMRSRQAKGRVLDEFCETTEYERKHAIKLLNGQATARTVRGASRNTPRLRSR